LAAPQARQVQEPPSAPSKPPEPPANNGTPPAKLPELPFTELDIAALRDNAPPAPARPAAAKPRSSAAGKKGSSRPLTELDMMVIRGRDHDAPKVQWPQKNSFIEVAWDQLMDSAGDIYSHMRRSIKELPTTKAFDKLVGIGSTLRLQADKPVVLLLGSGWGAHSIMKVIDVDQFAVVCVSPRNHFLFTPMLPSTAVGTVEFRSLLEPVRVANPFVDYFEASCDKIDLDNKVAYCTSKNAYKDGRLPKFEVPYDILVVSVGEQPATFGTPGVEENCFFMKEIPDSVGLRQRIQNQFELAALPGTSEDDMRTALHFVVVGGGPTGVEFAGTLSDFLREDLKKKYPELMPYVRVTLLNSAQTILTQFDDRMQQHAIENFKRVGVEVRTGMRVTGVTRDTITLRGGEEIKYGLCVWSAGNAPRPLVQQLAAQIPEQAQYQPGEKPSKLAVDPFLRVIGARDVLAIGDCTLMVGDRLPATAQVAGQQGAYVAHFINRGFLPLQGGMDQPPPCKPVSTSGLMDNMRDATMGDDEGEAVIYMKKPFNFLNLGALAYLGGDSALTEINLPFTNIKLSGQLAYLVWKSVYITKQVSFRNRVLILFDWLKAQVFGRDLSNF
jgi:NADH:ubiquinone reductase (non-electrogenic)